MNPAQQKYVESLVKLAEAGRGFADVAPEFGITGEDFKFVLTREARVVAHKQLTAPKEEGGEGLSTREAAKVTGVGKTTVERDIGPSGPPEPETPNDDGGLEDAPGPSGPPEPEPTKGVPRKFRGMDAWVSTLRGHIANVSPKHGGQINTAPPELLAAWHADIDHVIKQLQTLRKGLR